MKPWIGVDLDGTLAHYHPDEFSHNTIGTPIPAVLRFVRRACMIGDTAGFEVRIFTARVGPHETHYDDGRPIDPTFRVQAVKAIEEWCEKHVGRKLKVTATKDYGMIALIDDRAVQVVPNEGTRVDGRALLEVLM